MGEYMMIFVGFLGLARAQKLGAHVDVDLLFNRLSGGTRRLVRIVDLFLMLFFGALFFYATLIAAFDFTRSGEDAWFGSYLVPVWFMRWVAPIGLALFLVEVVIELVHGFRGKTESETTP